MADDLNNDKPLTTPQKRFCKNVIKGDNLARAAQNAGLMSQGYSSYLMRQPKIRQELARLLETEGVDDERLAKKLNEILDATLVKKDGGKEYPDYPTQLRAVETVFKVKRDIAADGSVESRTQINIILNPEMIKGLKDSKALSKEEIIDLEETMDGEYAPREEERNTEEEKETNKTDPA